MSKWTKKKLADVAKVSGGKRIPKGHSLTDVPNSHPYISVTSMRAGKINMDDLGFVPDDIVDSINRYRVRQGDIIVSVAGTLGLISKIPPDLDGANLTENADRISEIKVDGEYLFQLLSSSIFQNYVIGQATLNAQPKLSLDNLRSFSFDCPPDIEEQKKIAKILSTWDEAIEAVEELIEKKKLLLKRAYQELIRGHLFVGKVKDVQLSELFERVRDKNAENNNNVLTISAQIGLVNQQDYFKKDVSGKSLLGYYLIKKGDFAYNRSYSNGYPLGAIKRLDNYERGVVSTLYLCFRPRSNDIISDFYLHFFEAGGLNQKISQIAQEGARNHGLLNISVSDFFSVVIPQPSIEEQKTIANKLNSANVEIGLLSKKLTLLQKQKKGLMQRLLTGKVRVN